MWSNGIQLCILQLLFLLVSVVLAYFTVQVAVSIMLLLVKMRVIEPQVLKNAAKICALATGKDASTFEQDWITQVTTWHETMCMCEKHHLAVY